MSSKPLYDWYVKEWLKDTGTNIAWLEEETGWTHRIASQLVNRRIRWNRDHLNLAAKALKLEPWELLMPPELAGHIRNLRHNAAEEHRLRLVAEQRQPFTGESDASAAPRLTPGNAPTGPRRKRG